MLRAATWDEISGVDWQTPDGGVPEALWLISAKRMEWEVEDKGNAAFGHEVPLSRQAAEVLRALKVLAGHSAYKFPSNRTWREPMSDAALSTLYKRMSGGRYNYHMVLHSWRSAFSTIMNERAAEREADGDRMIIDMMLSHVPKGMSATEWAYNGARYLKPRRLLAQTWADIITAVMPPPQHFRTN